MKEIGSKAMATCPDDVIVAVVENSEPVRLIGSDGRAVVLIPSDWWIEKGDPLPDLTTLEPDSGDG